MREKVMFPYRGSSEYQCRIHILGLKFQHKLGRHQVLLINKDWEKKIKLFGYIYYLKLTLLINSNPIIEIFRNTITLLHTV